jgi:hypothetical protein
MPPTSFTVHNDRQAALDLSGEIRQVGAKGFSAEDLLPPCFFGVLVYLGIQTLLERVDQSGPLFLWQKKRFPQDLGCFRGHASITSSAFQRGAVVQ